MKINETVCMQNFGHYCLAFASMTCELPVTDHKVME